MAKSIVKWFLFWFTWSISPVVNSVTSTKSFLSLTSLLLHVPVTKIQNWIIILTEEKKSYLWSRKRVCKSHDRSAKEAACRQSIFRGKIFDYSLIVVIWVDAVIMVWILLPLKRLIFFFLICVFSVVTQMRSHQMRRRCPETGVWRGRKWKGFRERSRAWKKAMWKKY